MTHIHLANQQVHTDTMLVEVSARQEFIVLQFLAENRHRWVDVDELLHALYPGSSDVAVAHMRANRDHYKVLMRLRTRLMAFADITLPCRSGWARLTDPRLTSRIAVTTIAQAELALQAA